MPHAQYGTHQLQPAVRRGTEPMCRALSTDGRNATFGGRLASHTQLMASHSSPPGTAAAACGLSGLLTPWPAPGLPTPGRRAGGVPIWPSSGLPVREWLRLPHLPHTERAYQQPLHSEGSSGERYVRQQGSSKVCVVRQEAWQPQAAWHVSIRLGSGQGQTKAHGQGTESGSGHRSKLGSVQAHAASPRHLARWRAFAGR